MAGNKEISVGVKFTGDAAGFQKVAREVSNSFDKIKKGVSLVALNQGLELVKKGIDSAKIAFDIFKRTMDSTQMTGDSLAVTLGGIKEVGLTLAQSFATLDFSVSLRDAKKAAEEYMKVLDDVGDRKRSIDIISAENADLASRLKGQLRDTTLSDEQRLKVSAKIQEILTEELDLRKKLAEESLQGLSDKWQTKYKITLDQAQSITEYVKQYARFTREEQDNLNNAFAAQKKLDVFLQSNSENIKKGMYSFKDMAKYQEDVAVAAAKVTPELRKYIEIWRPLNDLTDEQRDAIKSIVVDWHSANRAVNEYLNTAEKAANKINARNFSKQTGPSTISAGFGKFGSPIQSVGNKLSGAPMAVAIDQSNEALQEQINLVNGLTGVFSDMFSGISGGFKGMADELIQSIGRIATELMAKAAVFTILKVLFPGAFIGLDLYKSGSFGKFLGIPSMASGGIASGPTLAMVGEYSGAGSNPEVIAPLSKLKGMVGQNNKLEAVIRGRDIYLSNQRYGQMLNGST